MKEAKVQKVSIDEMETQEWDDQDTGLQEWDDQDTGLQEWAEELQAEWEAWREECRLIKSQQKLED